MTKLINIKHPDDPDFDFEVVVPKGMEVQAALTDIASVLVSMGANGATDTEEIEARLEESGFHRPEWAGRVFYNGRAEVY